MKNFKSSTYYPIYKLISILRILKVENKSNQINKKFNEENLLLCVSTVDVKMTKISGAKSFLLFSLMNKLIVISSEKKKKERSNICSRLVLAKCP
jgi:hypothetical protein